MYDNSGLYQSRQRGHASHCSRPGVKDGGNTQRSARKLGGGASPGRPTTMVMLLTSVGSGFVGFVVRKQPLCRGLVFEHATQKSTQRRRDNGDGGKVSETTDQRTERRMVDQLNKIAVHVAGLPFAVGESGTDFDFEAVITKYALN